MIFYIYMVCYRPVLGPGGHTGICCRIYTSYCHFNIFEHSTYPHDHRRHPMTFNRSANHRHIHYSAYIMYFPIIKYPEQKNLNPHEQAPHCLYALQIYNIFPSRALSSLQPARAPYQSGFEMLLTSSFFNPPRPFNSHMSLQH
jgi:hypothetical protein